MNRKVYKLKLDNLRREFGLSKFIIAGLLALVAYLVFVIVEKTNSEKTVFMPPQVTYKEFWVTNNDVSKSYIEQVGTFLAYTLLNINEANADMNLTNIRPFIHSASYSEVRMTLKEMFSHVLNNQISRAFFLSYVDKKPKKILVHGSLRDTISGKVVNDDRVTLELGYKIEFGLLKITSIELIRN